MAGFSREDWIFSFKLFLASMIAFTWSVSIDLPQSYWSIVTCCVLMNPMTGAVLSKSVFRIIGTLCAIGCSIMLAGAFGSTPLLMLVATGLFSTLAFSASYLERTPRTYGFQLFGITILLICIPGADHPDQIFDTAMARLCEITLGIVSCAFVDAAVFPRSMFPSIMARLERWISDSSSWSSELASAPLPVSRIKIGGLISEVMGLSLIMPQARYDPLISKWKLRSILYVQAQLLNLGYLFLKLFELRQAEFSDRTTGVSSVDEVSRAVGALVKCNFGAYQRKVEHEIVLTADRLQATIAGIHDTKGIESNLKSQIYQSTEISLLPDMYLHGRLTVGIAILFAGLMIFWQITGWSQGSGVIIMAVISLVFFGNGDEPQLALSMFARYLLVACGTAGALAFILFPLAQDYNTFVLVMGIVMLPLGAWAATSPLAILVLANALSSINLQTAYIAPNFASFIESSVASMLGIAAAYVCVGLVRRSGVQHSIKRIIDKEKLDIIRLAKSARPALKAKYLAGSWDRMTAVVNRLGSARWSPEESTRVFDWLLLGSAIAEISAVREIVHPALKFEIDNVVSTILTRIRAGQPISSDSSLRASINSALLTGRSLDEPAEALEGLLLLAALASNSALNDGDDHE